MLKKIIGLGAVTILACSLSGCLVAKATGKITALPFQAVGKTAEIGGKTVYGTGKLTGQAVYGTGKMAYGTGKFVGKTSLATGKGVYYVGSIPVKITDQALDTTAQVLTITTQAVNLSGQVYVSSRRIQSYELDRELASLRGASNVLSVLVDVF